MASVSVSSLILFIAAIAIAATVSGVMVNTISDISNSLGEKGLDVARGIETDVEIISDAGSDAIYNSSSDTVTLLVKNTGGRTLEASSEGIDLVLDGRYVDPATVNVTIVGGGAWREGDVARVEISRSLGGGEHRVVLIVDEQREVFVFYT